MSYEELIKAISEGHIENYWDKIIDNSEPILDNVAERRQMVVSKELKMTQTQLSGILPILRALKKRNV